ncbi:hypothetical protein EW146_g7195 [Bondarzewia mesenterica]|uniref:Uncharacterized protein n=1 Tax=Bondarzewia mesenterica TaxID=1095465 RepID=A0A4S4LLF0_9AGAM|nr:hypothetical protein EW146_g7195 [Bondarzewia mesenterica]
MNVNAALPSLPTEILSTWASWRYPKQDLPTPPLTTNIPRRERRSDAHTTTLPPIADLDRSISRLSPPSLNARNEPSSHPQLPPVVDSSRAFYRPVNAPLTKPATPSPTPSPRVVADWFSESRNSSSQFLAEKMCEMICYVWFSKASDSSRHNTSPPLSYFPHRNSKTAWLQFSVSSVFVHFMQKLLETTQVSQSVIVLALHYIYRLKARNSVTIPHPGSEFRVAVAGLMMANKFVDDNTYTNKTWSEGTDFGLYVDKQIFDSWLHLLKGLVMAKEKDSRFWRKSCQVPRAAASKPPMPLSLSNRRLSTRARSTSPIHSLRCLHTNSYDANASQAYSSPMSMDADSPVRLNAKRSAVDAFSPTSAAFDIRPCKRPTGLSLEIPNTLDGSAAHTPSPLESLQFSKLSLNSSPAKHSSADGGVLPSTNRRISPQTLVAAYRLDPTKPRPAPQNLYFYSLACSPMAEDTRTRKARLRYHQPPPPPLAPPNKVYPPSHSTGYVIQSASTSPHDMHMTLPPVFSHPHNGFWPHHRPEAFPPYDAAPARSYALESGVDHRDSMDGSVPSAPFANAGPPGVQFYPTPGSLQSSPDYYWHRGRRL